MTATRTDVSQLSHSRRRSVRPETYWSAMDPLTSGRAARAGVDGGMAASRIATPSVPTVTTVTATFGRPRDSRSPPIPVTTRALASTRADPPRSASPETAHVAAMIAAKAPNSTIIARISRRRPVVSGGRTVGVGSADNANSCWWPRRASIGVLNVTPDGPARHRPITPPRAAAEGRNRRANRRAGVQSLPRGSGRCGRFHGCRRVPASNCSGSRDSKLGIARLPPGV